jgi:hypothetical protein
MRSSRPGRALSTGGLGIPIDCHAIASQAMENHAAAQPLDLAARSSNRQVRYRAQVETRLRWCKCLRANRRQAGLFAANSIVHLELAPGKVIDTYGYNGMVPGPVAAPRGNSRSASISNPQRHRYRRHQSAGMASTSLLGHAFTVVSLDGNAVPSEAAAL